MTRQHRRCCRPYVEKAHCPSGGAARRQGGSDSRSGNRGGRRQNHWRGPLAGPICAALFLSWEWQLGPVPPVAQRIFGSQSAYVLVGAASATLWLCVPMCLEHTATGRAWTTSPSMCALTALAGATLLGLAPLAELSLGGTAMCFAGIVGSTAMAAAPRGHLASSGMWNL